MQKEIPDDELPHKRFFMKRCTIDARPLEKGGLPSPSVMVSLGKKYGFRLPEAAWAASHLCPIEFHVQLVEHIMEQLHPNLNKLIAERSQIISKKPPSSEASSDSTDESPPTAPLAQVVGAILEREIDDLIKLFPSAEALKQVHFEEHLKSACDVLETDSKLINLSAEAKVKILEETLRTVMYGFLVANWEVGWRECKFKGNMN